MKNIKRNILIGILAVLLPAIAFAVNITVPAAPGSGYFLYSTSTGAYVYHSSSTAATDFGITSSQWTTTSTGIYYNGGRVGIGTASPDHALTVSGNGHFTQGIMVDNTVFTSSYFLGNVGIGTTTPSFPLVVYGTSTAIDVRDSGTSIAYGQYDNNLAKTIIGQERSTGGGIFVGSAAYASVFGSKNAYPLQLAASGTIAMTILPGGNVGIGTSTPASLLVVNGTTTLPKIAPNSFLATNGSSQIIATSTPITSINNGSGGGAYGIQAGTNITISTTTTSTIINTRHVPIQWTESDTSSTNAYFIPIFTFNTTSTITSIWENSPSSTSNTFSYNLFYSPNNISSSSMYKVFSSDRTVGGTLTGPTSTTSFASSTPGAGSSLWLYSYNASTTATTLTIFYQ